MHHQCERFSTIENHKQRHKIEARSLKLRRTALKHGTWLKLLGVRFNGDEKFCRSFTLMKDNKGVLNQGNINELLCNTTL